MNNISFSISANQNASQPSVACPSSRLTQHKRFVPYSTYPNSAFGGTSLMLRTLYATTEPALETFRILKKEMKK